MHKRYSWKWSTGQLHQLIMKMARRSKRSSWGGRATYILGNRFSKNWSERSDRISAESAGWSGLVVRHFQHLCSPKRCDIKSQETALVSPEATLGREKVESDMIQWPTSCAGSGCRPGFWVFNMLGLFGRRWVISLWVTLLTVLEGTVLRMTGVESSSALTAS